ncbi:MAG: hypothetical protein ACREQY_06840, partial [Candidatus Binatia bacterium]
MRNPKLLFPVIALIVAAPAATRAAITYPNGTTIEQAWNTPARISSDDAVAILAERLLAPHEPGTEDELGPEEFEALKFLVGDHVQASEEPPVQPGMRRFGGEITPESMTPVQSDFFGRLSTAIANGIGVAAVQPPGACVRQERLWEITKYKYDVGWNEVEVWGLTAFGHNIQYGVNHSDLVYGVFPWGIRMSWFGGIKCALDQPSDEDGLRACGTSKEWKIHGDSNFRHTSSYEHVVPGVAQASLTYAGALVSGEAGQFQTNYQTRETLDPSWLLGPSATPLPSKTYPGQLCIGDSCDT